MSQAVQLAGGSSRGKEEAMTENTGDSSRLPRRRTSAPAVVGISAASYLAYTRLLRPFMRSWGSTEEERSMPLPGDAEVTDPSLSAPRHTAIVLTSTRAITIDVPPEQVWPWLVQMGYRRAGWYAFDLFDNDGIPSAERIVPEFQHLRVGEVIGEEGNAVREIEPNRHLLLSFHYPKTEWVMKAGVWPKFGDESWCWFLKPIDGGERTRLITRVRYARKPGIETIYWTLFEVPDLLSARKQLTGIKRRAEQATPTGGG
jgi:uncharacterized protein YndB with AHSA1/START domain